MTLERIGVEAIVQGIGRFVSDMGRFNRAITQANASTQALAQGAGQVGRALTVISAPLIGLGFLSARSAITFETAFIGVQKTVDATEQQFTELEAAIRGMAQAIPASAEELSRLGETAGQLGIEVEAIEDFIRVVADLGVATNLSAEDAAVSIARLVTITGLSQTEFDRLGSALVDLGNNLAATESEILTFGLRIASAGQIAGLTEAEILAIGAAMSAVGIQAQAGGTAVQRVLLGMTEAVATTSDELAVFARTAGLTAQEFADLFERDAGQAFRRFVEGLGAAGDDAFIILRELGLEDQRLLRSFLSLAAAGDLLARSMDIGTTAFAENTALVIEAEKRYASAASQITIARNRFNELLITVGAAVVPAFLELLDVLAPVIRFLTSLAEQFPILVLLVIGLALVVGGLGVALIGLSIVLPGLTALFFLFAGGVTAAAVAGFLLSIAFSPITLAILAIGVALVAGIIIWRRYEAGVRRVVDILRLVLQMLNPITAALTLLETFTGIDVPGIRGFAEGGVQRAPGTAIVGERGPELVSLPAGAQVSPTGASRSTTFNVTANYVRQQDPQSIRLDLESITMRMRA
jgi:TP901 family phage tail tape measure protein